MGQGVAREDRASGFQQSEVFQYLSFLPACFIRIETKLKMTDQKQKQRRCRRIRGVVAQLAEQQAW